LYPKRAKALATLQRQGFLNNQPNHLKEKATQ
jgi:hypothetical protein